MQTERTVKDVVRTTDLACLICLYRLRATCDRFVHGLGPLIVLLNRRTATLNYVPFEAASLRRDVCSQARWNVFVSGRVQICTNLIQSCS